MKPFKPLTEADVRRIVREELAKQQEDERQAQELKDAKEAEEERKRFNDAMWSQY